ncbi:hypothetical protein AYO39_03430 [Actinobacteria bacterium SCGC AG-212-D09]|nr:hypothetical protein AYO39_03430 [Actinobacteria bacterium SCGC AG-212-D09]
MRRLGQIVACAAIVAALAACGGSSSPTTQHSTATTGTTTGATTATTGTNKHKQPVRNVDVHRCLRASGALVHSIQIGLNGKGGKTLTHTYAVLSKDKFPKAPPALTPNVYFVAASVQNRAGKPDVAVWVTGNVNGHSLVYPASSLANDISTYHKIGGSSSKPRTIAFGILPTSDGYRVAAKCVKRSVAGKPT